MSIGERIKSARRAAGITQKELGEMTNLSRSHIAALETGAYVPSLMTISRIAEVLRVSVSRFLDENAVIDANDLILTNEQMELLRGFCSLDFGGQQRVLGYMKALQEKNKPTRGLDN